MTPSTTRPTRRRCGRLAPWLTALLLAAPFDAAQSQPLFRSDSVLTVTITTNLRDLIRERDSTKLEWFGAAFTYADGDSTVTVPAELRARGHFRRQRRNCAFPPLSVAVRDKQEQGTILQGNDRLKLVTPCRPDSEEYGQYVLMEYGVYRAYQALAPIHPRTRLARITYVDSSGREDPITVPAFFLETDEEVAKEHDVALREGMTGATFADVHQPTLQSVALFGLLAGNSDWSLGGLHNIYILQDSLGVVYPVAYDWDWVGLVNTRYARPDYRLPIKSVTQRYYMGPCYSPEQWAPAVTLFRARRAEVDAVWRSIPGLSEKRQEQAVKYLEDFWKLLDDPGKFRDITKTCRPVGN